MSNVLDNVLECTCMYLIFHFNFDKIDIPGMKKAQTQPDFRLREKLMSLNFVSNRARNAISRHLKDAKSQNFPGLRPWTPLGGLTAPPQTPQLLAPSLRSVAKRLASLR